MKEKVIDMTQGAILPQMIRFAVPVLLGMLCQRVYNFADVYIVGKFLGDEALAAMSIAGSAMYLLFAIMQGLTTGVSVVLAQVISGALCLTYAWKILSFLRFTKENAKINRDIAKQILIYGVPTGLQMSIISISDMTLQGMFNTYGTSMVVAYGICVKVETVGWQLTEAIGMALGTFAGQNIGAGKVDRVKRGV